MAEEIADHTVVIHVAPGEDLDGRWRIETRIGQGAMGSVFRGREVSTGNPVAVKILSPEHCRKPRVLARFEREAQLLTTMQHPNIVRFQGWGRRGALPYIVMEYLEGMNLTEVMETTGEPLSLSQAVHVVRQVAAGLSFLHSHGLVHRDVKPQNVVLTAPAHATLLDLGVVRDLSAPGLTRPGAMVGTPYYMSPEQILGVEDIDKRTDVYALAAVTFELLTGRPPFLGDNNFEVLYGHKNSPPPDASEVRKSVPRTVARVLIRGLAKQREQRFEGTQAFVQALEEAAALKRVDTDQSFAFLKPAVPLPAERTRIIRAPARGDSGPVPMAESHDVVSVHSHLPSASESGESSLTEATQIGTFPSLPRVPEADDSTAPTRLNHQSLATGSVRVTASVQKRAVTAVVLVDGVKTGKTPRSLELAAGTRVIRVEAPGQPPKERRVTVEPGTSTVIRFSW